MRNIFKKKRDGDVIDLTLLEKKGLLKEEAYKEEPPYNPQPAPDYNLPVPTPASQDNQNIQIEPQAPTDYETNTGFFPPIPPSPDQPVYPQPESAPFTPPAPILPSPIDEYQKKDRLDKIEDRVEHVLDRLYKILQRIEILERKMERLERRSGIGKIETY